MSDGKRSRLDVLCVDRGLFETRTRAQAVIMAGGVAVDGRVVTKPGQAVGHDAAIEPCEDPMPYVSRGGMKLRHALDHFAVETAGAVCADIGASTGGFTDVLLKAGVCRVYAIDVGYGQLAWNLRNDSRVVVMERTNIRSVLSLPESLDLAVIDTSFISLRQVLPPVRSLLKPRGAAVALIKPQFEAGRDRVGKGVVRGTEVWRDVLISVVGFAKDGGWSVLGLERSPLKGPAGNVEFLIHLSRAERHTSGIEARIAALTATP
ncbi:MAG: TlyA family rRNA (cytidine-2'-O)-methyltransferase [Chloroflexi bacterium]|nr:MAG: TlyA family rRNA (cytidine-2'-O)-methyltransferase [Chloroflexota bacterium]